MLYFESNLETVTVFHLMGCLSQFGKLGLTSISDSPQKAEDIYHKVVKILNEETRSDKQDFS